MPNGDLTLFSYEILGLVGRNGMSPHDVVLMLRRGRMLAWAGESQYYAEPKRLAALGYLEARKEPGRTRERTVYTLTDRGHDALRDWAATPIRVTPFKSELLTRLLVADLVGEESVVAAFPTIRADIADLEARLAEARASADELPHRRTALQLTIDFLERLLALHIELIDRAERELLADPVT